MITYIWTETEYDNLWIGILKGIKMTVCGLNLENETAEILGSHYLYHKKFQSKKSQNSHNQDWKFAENAEHVAVDLAGNIRNFKSLAISKFINLTLTNFAFPEIIDF